MQQMARVRTKSIFGLRVPEKGLRNFAGGFANAGPIRPGAGFGNFVTSFQGAMGGALRSADVYDESQRRTQAEERQRVNDIAAQGNADRAHYDAVTRTALDAQDNALAWTKYNDEKNAPANTGQMTELQYFLHDPAGYKKFKDTGRGPGPLADEAPLTPEGVAAIGDAIHEGNFAAASLLGSGKVGAQNRAKAVSYLAKTYPGSDLAAAAAGYKADTGALSKMQVGSVTTEANLNTMLEHGNTALSVAPHIVDTGNMVFNRAARAAKRLSGDPYQAQMDAALQIYATEGGRILGQGFFGNNNQLSDSMRHEIKAMVDGSYTIPQLKAAMEIVNRDAQQKMEQGRAMTTKLRSGFNSKGAGVEKHWARDANGKLVQVQ